LFIGAEPHHTYAVPDKNFEQLRLRLLPYFAASHHFKTNEVNMRVVILSSNSE
jgi:hypothetical protein